MPSDKVPSQAEIDAQMSKVPEQPGSTPVANEVAPVIKPSEATSPSAQPVPDSLPAKLAHLESDFAIVKKELQTLLLDLREKLLEAENPFKAPAVSSQSSANTGRTETRVNEAKSNTDKDSRTDKLG
jgi:hypothetical protein